ncbi:TPA: hypothetical protein HA371_05930 [Candidatus Woesearchaeota archaeon]|nr:hypothetical protein [Candidatus Woesearchaeota archaeon]
MKRIKFDKETEKKLTERKERLKKQETRLEAEARALQERFQITGFTLEDLQGIANRSLNGLDMPVSPHFNLHFDDHDDGDLYHAGYTFTRADEKIDKRTLIQKLRKITNATYKNYLNCSVTYGPWQRGSFCGDGIYLQIISEEGGTIGRGDDDKPGNRFHRQVPYGNHLPRDTPKDELLRMCLEVALQRYVSNQNIRVKLNEAKK